jgi:hypothetical protein
MCCLGGAGCEPWSVAPCTQGLTLQCDGPEDCAAGLVCCGVFSVGIGPPSAVFCTGQCETTAVSPGHFACHTFSDCPDAGYTSCVPYADAGRLSFCK